VQCFAAGIPSRAQDANACTNPTNCILLSRFLFFGSRDPGWTVAENAQKSPDVCRDLTFLSEAICELHGFSGIGSNGGANPDAFFYIACFKGFGS
jgi:hypothetical protein